MVESQAIPRHKSLVGPMLAPMGSQPGDQRRRRPVQCRPAWPVLGPRRTSGPQTRYVHRRPTRRAAPHPRPHLAVLPQSQGLATPSIPGAQGDLVGPLRSHLRPQDRLRHPRPAAGAPARQQERIAQGARKTRDPAQHQRLRERHSLPGHQAQDSGGTRSDAGRDCRYAFLGLSKTCAKLGIAFWDYLGARLAVPSCKEIPALAEIVGAPKGHPNRQDFCPCYNSRAVE